jgi:hypothetical protein
MLNTPTQSRCMSGMCIRSFTTEKVLWKENYALVQLCCQSDYGFLQMDKKPQVASIASTVVESFLEKIHRYQLQSAQMENISQQILLTDLWAI